MAKIKSHKSTDQIAKKHGVDVSTIKNQLKIGIPIEHEHTKNHELATNIALQHLDEFPDYYTRLKKMEKSAKNVKESQEEQRYCPLCQKRESRSECSYGEKVWDKISVKDEEYSMARSEISNIENAVRRLKSVVGKGEGNLEAWVQSKITKAADYIDTAADYITGGEMEESVGFEIGSGHKQAQRKQKLYNKGIKTTNPHEKKAFLNKTGVQLPQFSTKEEKIIDKILGELFEENPCWKGYTQVGMKKKNGKKVPNCVPSKGVPKAKEYKKESVTIQDVNGNDFLEFVDLIKTGPIEIEESTRLQSETGNIISVTLSWRGKYYSIKMFFPQVKLPSRKEIQSEIQKIYPDSKVIHHSVSEIQPGQPLIRVSGSYAKPGPNKNYVKPMGEEVEIDESKKSEMPCNKPKAEAHGSGETGKSHVVKACEDGEEKLIRFGQKGVKGSPKKKGESEEYANRRKRFKARHAKNIDKGKMSAAFWSDKVKW